MRGHQEERHRGGRVGWLRASVLGANDGILSTASLILGVAAHATHGSVMVAGVAGLVSGSISMAAGEYVSVHSQADTERADLKLERAELKNDDEGEHGELMAIYVARGLDPALARQVAAQLMAHDALEAHARDELGISAALQARPIQAALASAGSFVAGAPCANVIVMIIGIISGVIPTASATENRNDSSSGRCKTMFTSRTKSTSSIITRVIISPKWRMPRPNSVSGGRIAVRSRCYLFVQGRWSAGPMTINDMGRLLCLRHWN